MISRDIQQEVFGLNASEKIYLIDLILESLDKPDIEIQDNWIEESEKRYDAFKSGKIKAVSFKDVLKRMDK